MKYYDIPEVISTSSLVDSEGDETRIGDRVLGIQVLFDAKNHREGTAQLDLREFRKDTNLIIEVPLSDLMAALTTATLNRGS